MINFGLRKSSFRLTIVNDDFSLDITFEDHVCTSVEKEQSETTEYTKRRGIAVLDDGECEKRIKETRRCQLAGVRLLSENGEREIIW